MYENSRHHNQTVAYEFYYLFPYTLIFPLDIAWYLHKAVDHLI